MEREITIPLLKTCPLLEIESRTRNTVVAYTGKERAKISCFNLPAQVQLDEPELYDGIGIASLRDLTAMKLLAVMQRGRLRDFIDLWAIEQQTGARIEDALSWAPLRFPTAPPDELRSNFLRALSYFEDAKGDDMPQLLNCSITADRLQKYWQKRVQEITRTIRVID